MISYVTGPHALVLFAQISNWRAMGTRFSGEHLTLQASDIVGMAVLVVGFGAGFWLLSRLGKWQSESTKKACPKRLSAELATAHGLARRECRWCREVAKEQGLNEESELYVRPDLCEAVRARSPELAERLFGEG